MEIFDFFLHLDEHMGNLISAFGNWTYVIIFLIVFAETGLVIMPFLPGDSLLFVVGTLSGSGFLNLWLSYVILLVAAILGDTVNYWIGHHFGARVFSKKNSRIFNQAYLEKTEAFYEKHGGKTIILARFVPIVRTFAPFVAGLGKMNYSTFLLYNVVGGFIWVTSLVFAGYFFGGLEFIQNNFELAVIAIVIISILPAIYEFLKSRNEKRTKDNDGKITYKEIKDTFKKEKLSE